MKIFLLASLLNMIIETVGWSIGGRLVGVSVG